MKHNLGTSLVIHILIIHPQWLDTRRCNGTERAARQVAQECRNQKCKWVDQSTRIRGEGLPPPSGHHCLAVAQCFVVVQSTKAHTYKASILTQLAGRSSALNQARKPTVVLFLGELESECTGAWTSSCLEAAALQRHYRHRAANKEPVIKDARTMIQEGGEAAARREGPLRTCAIKACCLRNMVVAEGWVGCPRDNKTPAQ